MDRRATTIGGLFTALFSTMAGCAAPFAQRADCPTDLSDAVGWWAAADDSILIAPSARGGFMEVDPHEERSRHVDQPAPGEYSIAGDPPTTLRLVRADCQVTALTLEGAREVHYRRVEGPYAVRELHYDAAGTSLAGIALLPTETRAGAIMVHGSGDSDRDNGAYLRIADHLARSGIATLVPDKRGVGESGGDWRTADFGDLADDAVAGVEALHSRVGDAVPIGLVGISQGGWVVPLAMRAPGVAFGVSLVGPAVTMAEQQQHVLRASLSAADVPEAMIERALRLASLGERYMVTGTGWDAYEALRDSIAAGPLASLAREFPAGPDHWMWDWARRVYHVDPLPAWHAADKPGLVVLGADDPSVPSARSAQRLREVPGVTVLLLEGRGHGLRGPDGGIDPAVLERVSSWVRDQTRSRE